jgi:hypothetical protein
MAVKTPLRWLICQSKHTFAPNVRTWEWGSPRSFTGMSTKAYMPDMVGHRVDTIYALSRHMRDGV